MIIVTKLLSCRKICCGAGVLLLPNGGSVKNGVQHRKVKMNYKVEVDGSATERKGFPGPGVGACCSIQRPRPISSRSLQPFLIRLVNLRRILWI